MFNQELIPNSGGLIGTELAQHGSWGRKNYYVGQTSRPRAIAKYQSEVCVAVVVCKTSTHLWRHILE